MKILVFDIWGDYAHFKKIYATTSALTYAIPPKTTLYGYIGALLGLEKNNNKYLESFTNKQCLIGLSVMRPLVMQRIGINLKAELGRRPYQGNPKPTMTEFVYRPRYRIYVHHKDLAFINKLKRTLEEHRSVYTPTLGLASLLSQFEFIGEFDTEGVQSKDFIKIHSVIPRQELEAFNPESFDTAITNISILEQSMYAFEMDSQRNITERVDIIVERNGNPFFAKVKTYYPINGNNICLF